MEHEFNKSVMLENISYLIKEKEMRVGELETEVGVSTGYISRIQKDSTAKPGIDFVVGVASTLNITVDSLLFTHLASLTPTERYLMSFIEKLREDTVTDKLTWNRESMTELNYIADGLYGERTHNLLKEMTFVLDDPDQDSPVVTRVVFPSHSFDGNTFIDGDCYNLKLQNSNILYLMHVEKSVHYSADPNAHAVEIWMYDGRNGHFICSDKSSPELSALIQDLYEIVGEYEKRPKINKEVRLAIDAFMHDLDDDQVDVSDYQSAQGSSK